MDPKHEEENKKISVTKEEQEKLEQEFKKLNAKMNEKLGTLSTLEELDKQPAIVSSTQHEKKLKPFQNPKKDVAIKIDTPNNEDESLSNLDFSNKVLETNNNQNEFSQTATSLKIDLETQMIAKERLEKEKFDKKKKVTKAGNNETLSAIVGFIVFVGAIITALWFFGGTEKEINVNLKKLTINGINVNIVENQTSYSLTIPIYQTNLSVDAIPEDSNATTSVTQNIDLTNNKVVVTVKNAEMSRKYEVRIIFESNIPDGNNGYEDLYPEDNNNYMGSNFNGFYKSNSNNGYYLLIYALDDYNVAINITDQEFYIPYQYMLEYTVNGDILESNNIFLDEDRTINITKIGDDIIIEASSTNPDSEFNYISGIYTKYKDATNATNDIQDFEIE